MQHCKCGRKLGNRNISGICLVCKSGKAPILKFCLVCGKEVGLTNKTGKCISCIEKENHSYKKGDVKRKATCLAKYGVDVVTKTNIQKTKSAFTKATKYGDPTFNNQEKHRVTCMEKFKFGHHWMDPSILEKRKKTMIAKYGVEQPAQSPIILEKQKKSISNRTAEQWKERALKSALTRSNLPVINGIKPESTWEEAFIKNHPNCKRGPVIDYELNGAIHKWMIDFEWNGCLYEVKNPFYFDKNYPQWHPEKTWAKWEAGNNYYKKTKKSIRWYLWESMFEQDWPALSPLEDFRNECNVGGYKSPKEAWSDPLLRFAAEENLAQQIGFGGVCLRQALKFDIQDLIIKRFTIAKIAPRVTAMSASQFGSLVQPYIKLLKEKGIYDPCGGFGGRKEFALKNNIEYESYDVNPTLIKEVGHKFRDLITMNTVTTDKIVATSPPWEDKEVWPGSNGSTSELHNKQWWYDLIREKVKAPGYIFINGALASEQKKTKTGLFGSRNNLVTTYDIT